MALTEEQLEQAKSRQRRNVQTGAIPRTLGQVQADSTPSAISQPKEDKLTRFADVISKPFEAASGVLFGSTGETIGGSIVTGIGAAKSLRGDEKRGKELIARGEKAITPLNIAFTVLELYPGGGFLSKALKKVPGGAKIATAIDKAVIFLPEKLQKKAIKLYTEALAPTTKITKRKAEKIVPELLKRKVTGRLEKLKGIAEGRLLKTGTQINELAETLPGRKVEIKPILDRLNTFKKKFIVDDKIIEPQAIKAAENIEKVILEQGEKADLSSLRKIRQIWDKSISEKSGFEKFQDEFTTLSLKAKKEGSNAIRSLLAKESPDLAKINAEYSFWRNVDDVVRATLERKAGQSGKLRQRLGSVIGATIGSTQGLVGAAVGTELGGFIAKAINSAAWKTKNAVFRNRFADLIIKGDRGKLILMLKELGVSVKNLGE